MTKPTILRLTIDTDSDVENPLDYGWKLYSFSHRHGNFKHPDHFDPTENDDIAANLDAGLAYWLDCYQHGGVTWSLSGEGTQCGWDTARRGGILVWEADVYDGRDDKQASARCAIQVFNDWCNGRCYHFAIEDYDTGDHLESCGGFIGDHTSDGEGADGITTGVIDYAGHLLDPGVRVVIDGDSAWAVNETKLQAEGVAVIDEGDADDLLEQWRDAHCQDELAAWEAMC